MSIHALVIDDDPQIIEDVQDRLESLGHTCDCASSQQEAREHLTAGSYSYILLDLEIPVQYSRVSRIQNGVNLLDEIRQSRYVKDIPVLVMTSHGQDGPNLAVEVLRHGRATDFVQKPFSANGDCLESRILEALDRTSGRKRSGTKSVRPGGLPPERYSGVEPDLSWEEISICLRDRHTISIRSRGASSIYNYAQMGLADRRNGNPTVQWDLLLAFIEGHGVLDWSSRKADRKNKKRRERLSRDLKSFFGIGEDPLPLTADGKGWRTRFSVVLE